MSKKEFTISELINNHSFRRWVEGHAASDEKEFWDEWIQKSGRNRRRALQAQQKWVGLSLKASFSIPEAKVAWRKIDDQIEEKSRTRRSLSKTPFANARSTTFRPNGMVQLMRYAAILALVLTGSFTWYVLSDIPSDGPEFTTVVEEKVVTGYGERKNITLSDGSEIVLNANSTLSYVTNPAESRAVEVTLEGEAWFSVTSRKSTDSGPVAGAFRVFTADGNVRVLGTRFSVSNRAESTRVVLEEGEVLVTPYYLEKAQGEKVVLKPNELAEYSRFSEDVKVRSVNTQIYTSWKDPKLVFEQTPVREIIERMEHTYGVQVVVRDSDISKRTITGAVNNTGIDSIFSVLEEALSISIERNGETVYLGGKI